MRDDEISLHDQGVALTLRLALMADRLQRTAAELQDLADNLRRREAENFETGREGA